MKRKFISRKKLGEPTNANQGRPEKRRQVKTLALIFLAVTIATESGLTK